MEHIFLACSFKISKVCLLHLPITTFRRFTLDTYHKKMECHVCLPAFRYISGISGIVVSYLIEPKLSLNKNTVTYTSMVHYLEEGF